MLTYDQSTVIYNQESWACPLPVVLDQKEAHIWHGTWSDA
jgi:hypothetical protein